MPKHTTNKHKTEAAFSAAMLREIIGPSVLKATQGGNQD